MANTKHNKGFSRRNLIQLTGAGVLAASIGVGVKLTTPKHSTAADASKITADEALQKLMEGNQRYVKHVQSYPDQDEARLKTVAKAQHPFAVILGCADSRVPPELLFDQGLGDLFVIRVAGNILEEATLASIEYATVELGVPLIMVMGHENCGAVTATLQGGEIPGHIIRLVEAIQPAVVQVKDQAGDPVDNAVRANIKMVVEQVKSSQPILAELVEQEKLKVVGSRYDLDTGAVELIA